MHLPTVVSGSASGVMSNPSQNFDLVSYFENFIDEKNNDIYSSDIFTTIANQSKKKYESLIENLYQLQDDAINAQREADEYNRLFQQQSAKEAMAFSAEQAQLNRDFQERMSNTAYQRAVADMREAGINPLLAYQQGGASTPTGSSASGVASSGNSTKLDTDQIVRLLQSFLGSSASMVGSLFSTSAKILPILRYL